MTNTFAHVQLAEILEAYDLNRQGLGQHPFAKVPLTHISFAKRNKAEWPT